MDQWIQRINPQLHTVWHGAWRSGILEPPRTLADHELVVISRGTCIIEVGLERIECRGPYYLVVPPQRRHRTIAQSDTFRYCAHFDWEFQRDGSPEPIYHYSPDEPPAGDVRPAPGWVPQALLHGTIPPHSLVLTLAQSLAIRWLEAESLGRPSCRAILLDMLIHLLARPTAVPASSLLRDRRTQLAMEIKNRLDFMELGAGGLQVQLHRLGYRYEHLCRIFKQVYGIPPLRYWETVRIEKAKLLLARTDTPLKTVAEELGFHDAAHFCRTFRRFTGKSPRTFCPKRTGAP